MRSWHLAIDMGSILATLQPRSGSESFVRALWEADDTKECLIKGELVSRSPAPRTESHVRPRCFCCRTLKRSGRLMWMYSFHHFTLLLIVSGKVEHESLLCPCLSGEKLMLGWGLLTQQTLAILRCSDTFSLLSKWLKHSTYRTFEMGALAAVISGLEPTNGQLSKPSSHCV